MGKGEGGRREDQGGIKGGEGMRERKMRGGCMWNVQRRDVYMWNICGIYGEGEGVYICEISKKEREMKGSVVFLIRNLID